MSRPRVTILTLGRSGALGEARRVGSWVDIFRAAGADPAVVSLLAEHRTRDPAGAGAVARGRAVPEAMAWSLRSVLRSLACQSPHLVVAVTGRSFHPGLVQGGHRVVLDYVDRLSVSYRDRSRISGSWPRRLLFRGLAASSARFERQSVPPDVTPVAAGWQEALDLNAQWVPNVVDAARPGGPSQPDCDVLFFGNLAYPPNIAAVQRLAQLWPSVQDRRPGATALVAGAHPAPVVRRLATRHGWELQSDFSDLAAVCARARLAVVPVDHTAGIQNKVLEAAALGLPQVVTPACLRGTRPGFPATVAASDTSMVDAIVQLLEDPGRRRREALATRDHVARYYSAAAWSPWARQLLAGPEPAPAAAGLRGPAVVSAPTPRMQASP